MRYIVRLLDRPAVLVCLLAGLATGALGFAGARTIALSLGHDDVRNYTGELLARAESMVRETNQALAEANRIEGEACGRDDITHLRKIAFTTRTIKDVGRLIDERLACSVFLGVIAPPFAISTPDIVTSDGHKIWFNTSLLLASGVTALVVQAGNANAVISPSPFQDLVHLPFSYSIAIINPDSKRVLQSWGQRLVDDSLLIARKDSSADSADDLVYVHCSTDYFICAVGAMNRGDAVARQSKFIFGFGAFSFFLGGFLSLLGFLLYRTPKPLSARLRSALRSNQLTLMFQPIVELSSGRVVAAEALIRWIGRDGKAIAAPDVFVSEAEANGTAGQITGYVLRHVCRVAASFLRANPDFVITVNIVAADLSDPNFYAALEQTIETSGIARTQIGLELTERSTAHLDVAAPAIARLRELGHPVYLDDFGTGYSSLAHLQDLNVNVIKLDKAFTDVVGTGSVKISIVPQILDMAKALGLRIVVEGIETEGQYDYFAATDCDCHGQGWLISRPLSFDGLAAFKAQRALG